MCAPQIPVGGTTAAITLTETEQSVLKSLSHLDYEKWYENFDPRIATDASTISLLVKLLSGSIEQQHESLDFLACLSHSTANRSAIRAAGAIPLVDKMLETMDPEEPDDLELDAGRLRGMLSERNGVWSQWSVAMRMQKVTPVYDVAEELKWVVSSLFELTSETGSYIKAKGEDGFFLTIARCTNPRVREAWRISCFYDEPTIVERCGDEKKKHAQLPDDFVKAWGDALVAAFDPSGKVWKGFVAGEKYWSNVKPFKFKTQTSKGMKDIGTFMHVYKLVRKPGAFE